MATLTTLGRLCRDPLILSFRRCLQVQVSKQRLLKLLFLIKQIFHSSRASVMRHPEAFSLIGPCDSADAQVRVKVSLAIPTTATGSNHTRLWFALDYPEMAGTGEDALVLIED
ncbi:hypothetical protein KCU88_g1006, partial [Aureobasidium melanogenum]